VLKDKHIEDKANLEMKLLKRPLKKTKPLTVKPLKMKPLTMKPFTMKDETIEDETVDNEPDQDEAFEDDTVAVDNEEKTIESEFIFTLKGGGINGSDLLTEFDEMQGYTTLYRSSFCNQLQSFSVEIY
jgi:hypothetical protein